VLLFPAVEPADRELLDREAVDRESLDREAVDREAVDREPARDAVPPEPVDREAEDRVAEDRVAVFFFGICSPNLRSNNSVASCARRSRRTHQSPLEDWCGSEEFLDVPA
jgi:hypothetical protein